MTDQLFAATRKGLFEFHRRTGGWQVARRSFLGSPVSMMLHDARDGALYAALDLGHFGAKLHRSDDGGANWQEIAAPSYAGVDADAEESPSLKLIWALEPGGADQPGVLWAGTLPGGLFKSTDRGESWTLVRSLWDDPRRKQWVGGGADQPGIHSISLDPRDSSRLAIAISCGGVWESADGGTSWHNGGQGLRADYQPPETAYDVVSQDAHRMVRCRAAPDHFWIQHHNGIFRARAGIDQWDEIATPHGGFGFAVAVHPTDPDTAWFVPAKKDEYRYPADGGFTVARTQDGGGSFETLRHGLPEGEAYDLVYRHALDIDPAGTGLAMGSTTGGLWVSETGGESWQLLPVRLPPVYAVRYGGMVN